jgi:fibrillarin-like pre-rRNA processing protein
MMLKLADLSQIRTNLIPILDDANKPHIYLHLAEKVDVIYSDVAQPNQTEIFMNNIAVIFKGRWNWDFDAESQKYRCDQKS